MKLLQSKYIAIAGCLVFALFLGAGVFAANNLVLNSGNSVELGAGAQRVNPCDDDVNLTPIVYNDGYNSYIQGFQYDNVNKAACVGYDIETRFVSNSETSMNAFTTSSIASEPNLVRVFAPTSSTSWRLGLGAYSTEVTVTQISASSFKVIFTTPIALVSDFGRFVMAELEHKPVGDFSSGYSEVGTTTGTWYGTCLVANSSKFYALQVSTGLYESSSIPKFPGSVGNLSLSLVSSSAIPTSGVSWYGLGCSRDGKYIVIGGTSNQLSYSSDYGNTWESRTATSYVSGTGVAYVGSNNSISISDDGSVVALATGGSTTGYFNIWLNGNFWKSTSTNSDAATASAAGAQNVAVCGDGTTIYGGGASTSPGLFRWSKSDILSKYGSQGQKTVITATSTTSSFGTYIRSIGCSSDGNYAVLASPFGNPMIVVTKNQFATTYTPSGFTTNNATQSDTQRAWTVSMSADGRFIAAGTGSYLGNNNGTTQVSTDYGNTISNTAFINRYMQTITISDDGSRIVTGGGVGSTKIVILGSN